MMRAVTWFTMLGAILGMLVGSIAGYRWALWYFSPGNSAQVQAALCPCLANAQNAIDTFIMSQLIGAAVGVVVLNVIGLVFRGKLVRRAAAKRAATSAPVV